MILANQSQAIAAGVPLTYPTVGWPIAAYLLVLNESPLTLKLDTHDGNLHTIPAQYRDLVPVYNGYDGQLAVTPTADLAATAAAPSSVMYVTTYGPADNIPATLVGPLVRQANVGNVTLTASQVLNDGNATVFVVVEATPSGALTSQLKWNNDGSGLFGGGVASVDNVGQMKWTIPAGTNHNTFTWDNTNFAGGHKLQLEVSTANEWELFDLTEAVTMFYLKAGGSGVQIDIGTHFAIDPSGNLTGPNSLSSDSANFTTNGSGVATATAPLVLRAGNQETGICGGEFHVVNTTTDVALAVNFKTDLTNAPSSISDVTIATAQETGLGFASFQKYGCDMFWKGTVATSNTEVIATYTTVGN